MHVYPVAQLLVFARPPPQICVRPGLEVAVEDGVVRVEVAIDLVEVAEGFSLVTELGMGFVQICGCQVRKCRRMNEGEEVPGKQALDHRTSSSMRFCFCSRRHSLQGRLECRTFLRTRTLQKWMQMQIRWTEELWVLRRAQGHSRGY